MRRMMNLALCLALALPLAAKVDEAGMRVKDWRLVLRDSNGEVLRRMVGSGSIPKDIESRMKAEAKGGMVIFYELTFTDARGNQRQSDGKVIGDIAPQAIPTAASMAVHRKPETPADNRVLKRLRTDLGQMLFGRAIVREASKLIGTPYRWGGDDPKEGFDCSGMTRFVFARFRIELPHSAVQQYRGGLHVEKPSAVPGDLVFFSPSSRMHVGIYLGDGSFIHAPSSGKKIKVDRLDEGYWKKHWHGVRRWLPDSAADPQ